MPGGVGGASAASSKKKRSGLKSVPNPEFVQSILSPCPIPILTSTVVPGVPAAFSNLTGSSDQNSDDAAYMAYARYQNKDEEKSTHSRKSAASFKTQDTFSTYGEVNLWGKDKFRPRLNIVDWNVAWTGKVVKSRTYKRISIALILANCALCAVSTFDYVTNDKQRKYQFDLAKDIFVYIMTAELLIHFLHHGLMMFSHGWLVFDFLVICLAWLGPNLLILRTFRVVRTLRLASWIKDLKELVLALLLVIPKMFAIFFLLLVLFFVFSILFTDLFKHTYEMGITKEDYFSRLDITLFTLFQVMTLDGWSEICKEVMVVHEWAWIPFISFVIVSSFFFLNLVIAVVCEAVTSVHRDTVVKFIQDDISAATSAREAMQVEDKLQELNHAMQLMMKAQITVLDTIWSTKQPEGETANPQEMMALLQSQKNALQSELKEAELRQTYGIVKQPSLIPTSEYFKPTSIEPVAVATAAPTNTTVPMVAADARIPPATENQAIRWDRMDKSGTIDDSVSLNPYPGQLMDHSDVGVSGFRVRPKAFSEDPTWKYSNRNNNSSGFNHCHVNDATLLLNSQILVQAGLNEEQIGRVMQVVLQHHATTGAESAPPSLGTMIPSSLNDASLPSPPPPGMVALPPPNQVLVEFEPGVEPLQPQHSSPPSPPQKAVVPGKLSKTDEGVEDGSDGSERAIV